ncbi:MAG: EAL domain-containing protein [Pseudomonadota bacterium]
MRTSQELSAALPLRLALYLWPALALLIGAALWSVAITRASTERTRAEQAAQKAAASYAEAYEQYLTRSVAQMDQVTMQLKQSWEQSRNPRLLEELKRDGMFTDVAFVAVNIVDRDGRLRSSTRPHERAPMVAASAWFSFHKNNNSTALRIDSAPDARVDGRRVVLLTRRLDDRDDEFDGVVQLAIEADYFTAFFSRATLGRGGMVAMAGADSALRVERHDDGAAASSLFPPDARHWPGAAGVRLVGADQGFADGQAHILGWHRSGAYPLVALVALSHDEVQEAVALYWRDSRNNTALASACLALLAALATVLSRRAHARLREQDEVRRAYRTATESANDGFYMAAAVHDDQGRIVDFEIVDCNERGAYFYGMARSALVGSRLSSVDSSLFGEELISTYRAAMQAGFHEDDRRMPADNRLNITWGHRRLVRVGNGLAVTLQDISERKAHEAELQRLANQDGLTGLPNRHWLINFMPGALAQARAAGSELALLFIDLDEFKHVNDTQGHEVGDQLLRAAAQRLTSLLRPTDHVVRFGGDEFIVLLLPCESEQQVASVAQRIVGAFGAPFALADDVQAVGASVGISMFPRDGDDSATLIKHSDIAMYAGKTEGKGQYRFFDPSLSTILQSRAQLKHSLLDAIEKDQFVLYYQPRVDTLSGELCSMEALLRWVHPQHGIVSPLDFIPLAEASGLILRIGEMVIDKACAQLSAWRAQGVELVPISINVSPKQFARGDVHRQLAGALERHRIAPTLLEVEITESAMMGEQDEIIAELAAIRALGVKLHVDDFGTGYSSLSQLQRLKMDVLKVDRAFTSELGNSREGKVFFQAIVSMAHALGMSVVAEGVETEEQLRILQGLACNEVQGYFISRPLPAREIAALIERRFLFRERAPALTAYNL